MVVSVGREDGRVINRIEHDRCCEDVTVETRLEELVLAIRHDFTMFLCCFGSLSSVAGFCTWWAQPWEFCLTE